jgi:hypothetical protein
MKKQVRNLVLLNTDVPPTEAQIEACKPWTDLGVGDQSTSDWYCLLRNAQGSLTAYLAIGVISNNQGFLLDSLFCEYAYIVNLDDMMLEFYRGFNTDPKAAGRYASQQVPPCKDRGEGTFEPSEYYGVVLIDTIPLADLPKTKRCKTFVNKTVKKWWESTR